MPSVFTPFSLTLHGVVDEVTVERLVTGDRPTWFTAFERREAVRQLRLYGLSYNGIAQRIGVCQRQVHRDLQRLGFVGVSESNFALKVSGPTATVAS